MSYSNNKGLLNSGQGQQGHAAAATNSFSMYISMEKSFGKVLIKFKNLCQEVFVNINASQLSDSKQH